MRKINCILCGENESETKAQQTFTDDYLAMVDASYNDQVRRWAECKGCGFIYHTPQLDAKDQKTLYDKFRDESYRKETPDQYFDRITSLPPEESENTKKSQWLGKRIPEHLAKGGTLLDIGCGGGVFIHTFRKHFPKWTARGIEPTRSFAELAQRRLDLPVHTGIYAPGVFEGMRFDLITINQVLEHVDNPVSFLEEVRGELAENGIVYIETPEASDFGDLPEDHDRFLAQHLWYFDEKSITALLKKAGFEPVAVEKERTVRERNNLVALFRAA